MRFKKHQTCESSRASRLSRLERFQVEVSQFFLLLPPKLQIFSAAAMVHSSRLKLLLPLLCRIIMMLRCNLHLYYEFWMRALWIFAGHYGSVKPSL